MPFFTSNNGADIYFNLERSDLRDGEKVFQPDIRNALKLIKSAGPTKKINAEHLLAADAIYDAGICISPYAIFEQPLHRDLCKYFNDLSEIGWELREALEAVGAFAFLDGVNSRSTSQGIIERILAVFTVSASGLSRIVDMPPELVHAAVDFFRSPDGLSWNPEILGKGAVASQCVSNVVAGLAKIFDDGSLVQKARKHRAPSAHQSMGWHSFQYSTDILDREMMVFYKEFRQETRMRPAQAQTAALNLTAYIRENFPTETIRGVAASAARPETFVSFLKKKSGGKTTRSLLATVKAARKLSVSITEHLGDGAGGRTWFDLVTSKDVARLEADVKKIKKPSSTRSRPLPEKLIPLMREILEEGGAGWPGKNFQVNVQANGKLRSVYCPVIPSLFHAMLLLPLRMGQLRRLDSGEGDVRIYDGNALAWKENRGPLAGYWADLAGEPADGFPTRGYAIEIEDEIKPITGVWVNTNKTGKPFAIPWHIPELFRIFEDVRKWQIRYNPITAPIGPEIYLDAPQQYSDETKEEMPHVFPLARLFPNKYWPTPGRTVTRSELDHAWCLLLQEIQRRHNLRHPANQLTLVDVHPKNNQPYRPRYNIHGLRVRGLTNLRRGGMPLDLLSKFIAGHASLLMTIYYTEPHASEVADEVEKAAARSLAQREFIDDLRRWEIDEAKRNTVSVSPNAVADAIGSGSQMQFINVAIGVCPFDGSRCWDGGALRRKDEGSGVSKSHYDPVEPRNCVMCRHFISGPPWLNELTEYGTKMCARRRDLARDEARLNQIAGQLEDARDAGSISAAAFDNQWDDHSAEMQKIKNEQELVENSIFNVELLCDASVKLLDQHPDHDGGIMLVANAQSSMVEYKQVSEFEQAVRITAAGRVHHILGDDRIEARRNEYVAQMLFHSGITPPQLMTNVSPEHRRRALDQYALFVNARVPGDQIDGLIDGTVRLRDLGLEDQVRKLIDTALSQPIPFGHLPGRTTLLERI
ncbi:hypothetical protein G6L46_16325 [Agrobacterium rhizogenes]|uniref:VPA1269 family protein n=1 Tax=Rhizobium rhizogenes TaxID=359 RepID=UPI001573B64B|nr:VPA1269 family protein [Rhizobium rhizogenes]NTF88697.1 hypothetical protein [Rhizobium rhizogenes]